MVNSKLLDSKFEADEKEMECISFEGMVVAHAWVADESAGKKVSWLGGGGVV